MEGTSDILTVWQYQILILSVRLFVLCNSCIIVPSCPHLIFYIMFPVMNQFCSQRSKNLPSRKERKKVQLTIAFNDSYFGYLPPSIPNQKGVYRVHINSGTQHLWMDHYSQKAGDRFEYK